MKERGERRCNSGSVALDGRGRPMAFYTFVPERPEATRLGKREQWGAVPLDDDLIQWQRVKDGPLMAAGMNGVPADINAGWSDPFVFRSGERTFVTFKSCNGVVCEAKNAELTEWAYAGRMDGVDGECPNFFKLEDTWVLLRSTMPPTYVIGDFDAEAIAFHMNGPQGVLDYGFGEKPPGDRAWTRGLYATNTFFDANGRCIMVGWVCGFKPRRGWNGCMSLPRVLSLDKQGDLVQTPAPELHQLRGRHVAIENLTLHDETKRIQGFESGTLEVIAEFAANPQSAFGLKLRCSEDSRRGIVVRWAEGMLDVAGTVVPLELADGSHTLRLHVFLDRSVLEVFINGGAASVTRVEYAEEEDLGIAVFAQGHATVQSMDVWEMGSIW
jgi:beta-fructofuranosidase